jgi:TrmH family RNA methyltransferase
MPSYDIQKLLQDKRKSFLLLDDLRDPGNLGTIMRTAEGADMSGVILSKESVDLFNPKVVRSTMGAIFRVPFYYTEHLTEIIEQLKQNEISVYGTMMQGSVVYDTPDYRNGAAIVIGNEANGISDDTAKKLSAAVRIPMAGSLESLNAAVSAAILMYEVARQKRQSDIQ